METIDTRKRKLGKDGRIGFPKYWNTLIDKDEFGLVKCRLMINKNYEYNIVISGKIGDKNDN